MDVGDLLQLQRAFERQRVGGAAAEIKDVAGQRDSGHDLLDALVVMQHLAGARRHLGELAGEPHFLRRVDRAAARGTIVMKAARTASWVVKALVEATPISGAARVGRTTSASVRSCSPAG